MAELAAGAVNSLLGVINSEARLLRLVRSDVQFIKEEMESMNSFLIHLERSAPPGGEHDEQVRTWTNQVRLLAQDCNNCIAQYRISGGLWWVPRFLHKWVAQHRAAVQLRELRDRARDVSERRIRYGVEVPSKSAAGQQLPPADMLTRLASSSAVAGGYAADEDDEKEDIDDDPLAMGATTDRSAQRAWFSRTLEDYVKTKLLEWSDGFPPNAGETRSIAIMAPDRDPHALRLAYQALVFGPDFENKRVGYDCAILVDIPALHPDFLPLRPKEVLYYILHQLKLEQSTYQGEEEENWPNPDSSLKKDFRKNHIGREKKRELNRIKEKLYRMKVYEKLDKITYDIQTRATEEDELDPDVHVLLRMRFQKYVVDQLKNKGMTKLSPSDGTITKIAKKLKECMEEDEQGGGQGRKGAVGRGVENEAVQEEDCEGAGKETVEEKRGGKEILEGGGGGGGGGEGDIVEERAGGRGEIVEEDHKGGGQGEILEEEHGGGVEEDDDDGDSYDDNDKNETLPRRNWWFCIKRMVQHLKLFPTGFKLRWACSTPGSFTIELQARSHDDNDCEEEQQQITPIYLHEDQYVHILRQVFLKNITSNKSSSKQAIDTILVEDQIKQMIHESKEDKHDEIMYEKFQDTEENFKEIVSQKMDKLKHEFKEQLKMKKLVDDIKCQLKKKRPLFILKISEVVDVPRWEDTRNALSLLACGADVLIVITTKDVQQAKEYCYPQGEPIDYSLVGLYYDTVLEITKQQKYEKNYNPQIFRSILEQCEPHEFCMKIFAHALYINPKRSSVELNKLHRILQASPKSFNIIAKKMLKFSYTDMTKEYKSCLLYLAIFTPGYKIGRSTLIGQWVAEGLISKEDWPSSVHWANRCFDELINRCLVDPADTSATGKVKSCVVSDLVHGFITGLARKQHMVDTRLTHHLAGHFSIFNALQLRSSDKIDGFFQRLSKSSDVSLLTVLDLEGCQWFGRKNKRYLNDICRKMLLLKYLSLRGTDTTQLPSEINNLHELEVLDIRQTNVPMNATGNVLLLKLKRLLAGNTDRSPSSSVQIPHKIEKMVNMEVLSNVRAQRSRDLKDIGKLWQLRKLGVVVDDNSSYLENLLRAISDLHECLCSLSITLPTATPSQKLPEVPLKLKHQPKLLESLSISGTTQKGFLPLFIKDVNSNLVKLTLSSTSLYEVNLKVLARLPKLQVIRLRQIEFTDIESLIFEEDEFKHLKYLLVEGSSFTKISFENEAACGMLEKIVLSFTSIESVSGVDALQTLEEVELSMSSSNKEKNDTLLSSFNNGKQTMVKLTIVSTPLEQGQETQNMFTFNEGEFQKLKLLTVDCSATTEVVFSSGSAPKLEKIIWSSSTSLSGIDNLPKLMELEFNGDLVPEVEKEAIKKHKNKPTLKHIKPEIQDQAKGDEQEDEEDAAKSSLFCWK